MCIMWRCAMLCMRRIPLLSMLFMIAANCAYAVDFNGGAANYNLNVSTINESSTGAYQVAGLQFLPDFTDSEFGWHGSTITNDYSSGNSCDDYDLSECPDNASCTKCAFGKKFKMNGCLSGYKQSGTTCTPMSCDKIDATYKSEVPENQVCSVVSGISISCYKGCNNISCSNYSISSCPSNANCSRCPDCETTDSKKGSCSPDKYKVISCKSATQKVNAGATACIDKDDTCPSGYFKSCETGTQGNPEYTEKGTACYQCKAAPCEGYSYSGSCPNKYYTAEKCPTDASKLKCTATCGSKIVDANPTYKIDEYNSSGVTVVTKDATYLPGGSTIYSNINFPDIPECAALPKPTITQTLSDGRQGMLSVGRIENINFVYNFQNWTKPEYCSKIEQLRNSISDPENFCSYSCSYSPSSYYLSCKEQCNNPGNLDASYQYTCQLLNEVEEQGSDACYYLTVSSSDSGCSNSNASPSLALELYPTQSTSNLYGNDATVNNIGYLKNVDITVNGSPNVAVEIGGGAWVNKTIVFEGTNTVKGGSKYTFWLRGHNSGSYGHVKGVLKVASGAKLTASSICEYTQWNGLTQKYGTLSGTVNTNCSTYTLKW